MPRPLPPEISFSRFPNVVLTRPLLAAQIGNVCANWVMIEDGIMMLYGLLMGTYLPSVAGYSPPIHPVALQVFDNLTSIRPRLELLKSLADWKASGEEKKKIKRIAGKISELASERNTVAHGDWGAAKEYPDELVLSTTFHGNTLWSVGDFESISTKIESLRAELWEEIIRPLYGRLSRSQP